MPLDLPKDSQKNSLVNLDWHRISPGQSLPKDYTSSRDVGSRDSQGSYLNRVLTSKSTISRSELLSNDELHDGSFTGQSASLLEQHMKPQTFIPPIVALADISPKADYMQGAPVSSSRKNPKPGKKKIKLLSTIMQDQHNTSQHTASVPQSATSGSEFVSPPGKYKESRVLSEKKRPKMIAQDNAESNYRSALALKINETEANCTFGMINNSSANASKVSKGKDFYLTKAPTASQESIIKNAKLK